MNANKLADDLERQGKFPGHVVYGTSPLLIRCANKLRKQQAEIEALKATIGKITISNSLTDDDLEQLVTDMPTSPSEDELYEFAYNVLRKAQEK
jgi:hypothetical protein